MKSISICSYNVNDNNIEGCNYFSLSNINIPIGIIDQNIPNFDEKNNEREFVLLKKDAFSCSYRDRALIIDMVRKLNINSNKDIAYSYPVGSEFVGKVIKVGDNVSNLKVGDRVIPIANYPLSLHPNINPGIPTNYASKRFQALHEMQLLKIPDKLPDEIATSISICGHTVFNMIEKAQIKNGDNILVTSLKSNTSLAILAALKKYDCNIYGLSSSPNFLNNFLQLGVKEVFFIDKAFNKIENLETFTSLSNAVGGFNIVFDPFADLHLGMITNFMGMNSKYLTCGTAYQADKPLEQRIKNYQGKSVPELLNDILLKNIYIIGNCLGEKRHLETAIQEYLNGHFEIPIDNIIDGNNILYFFDRTFNDPRRFGKVVYKYND